jgi:hypothetical protein
MSKFLLNLLVQISKAMVYSKIKFYSEKKFFSSLPAHSYFFPAAPPLFPLGLGLTAGPAGLRTGGAPPNHHLPHRKMPPAAPPLPSLRARLTDGPHLSSLTSGPPEAAPPPPPAAPRAAQPHQGCRPSFYHPTIISPSLIPPLNLANAFNGINAINAAVTPPATLSGAPPGPNKRAMRPPTLTTPHPLSPELFRALLRPRDELKPPPFVASGAPPLRHPSVAGEHLPSTASTGLSSPSIVGEHR